ncbi:MAG: hypothetical protein ABEL76_14270 [Bradymonadaceae bacterium]
MRHLPILVRGLGALGLAATLSYMIGVLAAVTWPGTDWAAFWLRRGPVLVAVPVLSLISYLVVRVRAGAWLLEVDRVDQAMAYAGERLEAGLGRSRLEALSHGVVFLRAALRTGEYDRAADVVEGAPTGGLGTRHVRARLELLGLELDLREERYAEVLERASGGPDGGWSDVRARWWAAGAEAAALEGDSEQFERCIEEANWVREGHARTTLARVFGGAHLSRAGFDTERAAEAIDRWHEEWTRAVPGRSAELFGLRADFAGRMGDRAEVERQWRRAVSATADARASRQLERIADRLDRSTDD